MCHRVFFSVTPVILSVCSVFFMYHRPVSMYQRSVSIVSSVFYRYTGLHLGIDRYFSMYFSLYHRCFSMYYRSVSTYHRFLSMYHHVFLCSTGLFLCIICLFRCIPVCFYVSSISFYVSPVCFHVYGSVSMYHWSFSIVSSDFF
jgi:hypothetical protein